MPRKTTKRTKKGAEEAPRSKTPLARHQFVPPHELLTAEEGLAVLESLHAVTERLPKIRADDPGLQTDPNFRAAQEGGQDLNNRLVRIRRHSQTAGDIEIYRVIVTSAGE